MKFNYLCKLTEPMFQFPNMIEVSCVHNVYCVQKLSFFILYTPKWIVAEMVEVHSNIFSFLTVHILPEYM